MHKSAGLVWLSRTSLHRLWYARPQCLRVYGEFALTLIFIGLVGSCLLIVMPMFCYVFQRRNNFQPFSLSDVEDIGRQLCQAVKCKFILLWKSICWWLFILSLSFSLPRSETGTYRFKAWKHALCQLTLWVQRWRQFVQGETWFVMIGSLQLWIIIIAEFVKIILSEGIIQANTELRHEAHRLRFCSLRGRPRIWSGIDSTLQSPWSCPWLVFS